MLFRIDGLFVVFHHRLPREKDILRTACREKQPAKLHKSEDSENARKQKTLTTGYVNTRDGVIPTGVIMTVAPFAAVTLLGGAGAVTMVMKKKKSEEE